jgi:cytochrome b561
MLRQDAGLIKLSGSKWIKNFTISALIHGIIGPKNKWPAFLMPMAYLGQHPGDASRWQRIAARITHWALYLATILVAMLGWAMAGARAPDYSSWFGLFNVPQITSPDKAAANAYEERHIFFAYVLLALIAIHIAAAAWHHFIRRDQVAMRMIRGGTG